MHDSTQTFKMAIVDSNILSGIALKGILQDITPIIEVSIFTSFSQLRDSSDMYVHYFVSSSIFFEYADFFRSQKSPTIVLVNGDLQINGIKTVNVCQSEHSLIKSLLSLHQHNGHSVHAHGTRSSCMTSHTHADQPAEGLLSSRETEVAVLLAKGYINKEIANKLNISTTTVITHRKNIMEKLKAHSLANIIIYVVMNGLVDIGEL